MKFDAAALSCPLESGYEQAVSAALQILIERVRGDVPVVGSSAASTSSSAWRFELGALLALGRAAPSSNYVGQLAIWKFLSGLTSSIHVRIEANSVFAFNELLVCPPYRTIAGSIGQVRLIGGDGQSACIREFRVLGGKQSQAWVEDEAEYLQIGDWFSSRMLRSPCPLAAQSENHRDDFTAYLNSGTSRTSIEDSLLAVETFLPEYKSWVSQLTRCIVLAPRFGRGTKSTSFHSCPGHIHLSEPVSVPFGVVTLVHECAHQHYHLLGKVLQLSRAGATAYSAVKESYRPVEKVLLAFHAFANALIALKIMFDRGYRDSDFDRAYRGTAEYVSGLRNVVHALDVPDVTLHGRSLVVPLLNRINACLSSL